LRFFLHLAALLAFLIVSCRSTGGGAPFAPVAAGTGDDAVWRDLQSRARSFEGARSYLRLRLTDAGSTRTFNARFFASREGRVLLEALTPLGTAAFRLYLDGTSAMWLDDVHSTYWEGRLADVAPLARLVGSAADSRSFAMIVLGLPIADSMTSSAARHVVGVSGLESIELSGDASGSRVEFAPAAFPPSKLTYTQPGRPDTSLQVEHLELSAGPQDVKRPAIPRGYTAANPAL
jgi:hypothetical protein